MASAPPPALLACLALLAAGCLEAADEPVERAGPGQQGEDPAPAPDDDPVSIYDGRPVQPPSEEECGEMTLEATPRAIRPGEEVILHGAFRNCGAQPLERTTPCTSPQWGPRTTFNGTTYHAHGGAAHDAMVCLTAIGHWRLEPGEALEGGWRWNGTFTDCRQAACATEDAPPGPYEFTTALSRKDAMTQQGEGAWTATVLIEVLAE